MSLSKHIYSVFDADLHLVVSSLLTASVQSLLVEAHDGD